MKNSSGVRKHHADKTGHESPAGLAALRIDDPDIAERDSTPAKYRTTRSTSMTAIAIRSAIHAQNIRNAATGA
ncbi:hypothetical protein, partial [Leifsonia poae]|uniref:hypothetical protein n=1 Tax=Leifsonia poae TaxID=110933 RepID=UPI001CC0BD67